MVTTLADWRTADVMPLDRAHDNFTAQLARIDAQLKSGDHKVSEARLRARRRKVMNAMKAVVHLQRNGVDMFQPRPGQLISDAVVEAAQNSSYNRTAIERTGPTAPKLH